MQIGHLTANQLRSYQVQHDKDEIIRVARYVHGLDREPELEPGAYRQRLGRYRVYLAVQIIHRKLRYAVGNWGGWEGDFWLVCLEDQSTHFGPLYYLLDTITTWSTAHYSLDEPVAPKKR